MPGATIVIDEATPLLERMRTAAAAQGLALVGARAGAQLVREHLFGLDGQRHRHGRHFYAQAARSVTAGRVPQGAAISVTQQGFRQRLRGGTIKAKPGKALTLPEDDEAQGKRAGEFKDLHLAYVINPETGALQPALVRNISTPILLRRRKNDDGTLRTTISPQAVRGGEVMYWLVREVTQQPDPSVLPREEQISARVTRAMQDRIVRQLIRADGTGGDAS